LDGLDPSRHARSWGGGGETTDKKIAPCRVCGHPVSEYAPACPNCGDPTALRYGHKVPGETASKGTSPWRIIGWIFLSLTLLWLGACFFALSDLDSGSASIGGGAENRSRVESRPEYALSIVWFSCNSEHLPRGEITVRNTGNMSVPYAKAFVEFTDVSGKVVSSGDSYFSPSTIPVGSTASATVYGNPRVDFAKCGPSTVQDGGGNPVRLISAE
jgi:hypothetical protein